MKSSVKDKVIAIITAILCTLAPYMTYWICRVMVQNVKPIFEDDVQLIPVAIGVAWGVFIYFKITDAK